MCYQASNDEDGDVLAENQKEMLRLQKLASAASSKVIVLRCFLSSLLCFS